MIVPAAVIKGNEVAKLMTHGPPPAILKVMVVPGLAFAKSMADRKEPEPLSLVLETTGDAIPTAEENSDVPFAPVEVTTTLSEPLKETILS